MMNGGDDGFSFLTLSYGSRYLSTARRNARRVSIEQRQCGLERGAAGTVKTLSVGQLC